MRVFGSLVGLLFSLLFLSYLALPNYPYPAPPPGAVQSQEEADTEDSHERRAYFTDFTREEVMDHYQNQLKKSSFLGLTMPTYRLNYPPEEAFTLIRDQTRSTGLEEIVHPLRQSFFVNFFEPVNDPQNAIGYKGIVYRQKITVAYKPSNMPVRVVLGLATLGVGFLVWPSFVKELKVFVVRIKSKKLWTYR